MRQLSRRSFPGGQASGNSAYICHLTATYKPVSTPREPSYDMDRMAMRTLQIGNEWYSETAGGLNSYYFELLRHLPSTGTDVYGLVAGSDAVRSASHGQAVSFAPPDSMLPRRMLAARRLAFKHLSLNRIDVIASHFALYTMPILDLVKKIPTVVHFHGPWAAESSTEGARGYTSRAKAALERRVYTRARRLIVLSNSFKNELIAGYGIAENRIVIVPGGVDLDRFNTGISRAEARRQLGWPTNRPIILTVRRQVRRMGLETLLDAAKLLVAELPDVLILLGGTGPLADELQQRIVEFGLEHNVRRLGRVEDAELPLAYRGADLTVVPSQTLEGFGLITLESLASGTPVYVTPVGGLPEIVEPFAPECIFGNTSADEMAKVLRETLRGERPAPSDQACRAYAADNFSWSLIAQRVRTVYDQALA
jgi:glycogen(starch) synthase